MLKRRKKTFFKFAVHKRSRGAGWHGNPSDDPRVSIGRYRSRVGSRGDQVPRVRGVEAGQAVLVRGQAGNKERVQKVRHVPAPFAKLPSQTRAGRAEKEGKRG